MNNGGPGLPMGRQFGPYRLIRLLGSGGMGEVYEAEDLRKHRMVAVKLVSAQFSDNPELRARMQREADTAGRLTEPHVVPIHDYGEIDGRFFVEMRLIRGDSLRALLKRYGPLSPARAVAVVRQVASALDAAHGAGVMHRDVKPENILVTNDGFAYLMDFGLARAVGDPALTETGTAVGTYKYMAPERFTGMDVTYQADVYSLACVLTECLTGSPPFAADNVEEAIGAHVAAPPPRPSEIRPGRVPVAFDAVIARGMAKRPEDRYRSAGDLAIAAHEALTEHEQDQVTTILRQGERAAMPAGAAGAGAAAWRTARPPEGFRAETGAAMTSHAAETMVRPALPPTAVGGRADQPGPPAFGTPPGGGDGRKRWAVIGAVVLALVAAASLIAYLVTRPSQPSSASGQTDLQMTGINFRLSPSGVALAANGDVYVTSEGMYGRVVKLSAGSTTPTVLPFAGLYQPQSVAVDANGTAYVSDFNNRVVKLTAGSTSQVVLPFTGLNYPEGVAVDAGGGVYVADRGNNRVMKLPAGSNTAVALPFSGLNHPDGLAVDSSGTVYVADTDNNRVVKLVAGSSEQTVLPFTGISVPWGVAVDGGGDVYVTEHDANRVLKLPAGAVTPTVLPFSGLNTPLDVAVDKSGEVYVADRGNNRVVKLAG